MGDKNNFRLKAMLYCCALGMCGHSAAADVTDTSPAGNQAAKRAAADAMQTIEEVTVTATKRRERMQDVPISMTALSERALDARGIGKAEDYLASLPGLSLLKDASGQASFTVRGIGTGVGAQTTSAPAGVYIDDYAVYDSWFRYASPDLRIFDVERIEALRGPQGTLFGASSLSGAIRIITNKPDPKNFEAKVEVTGAAIKGGDNDYALNAMINQPLSADTALRLVAYDRRDGGWIDNPVRGQNDVNSGKSTGARVALSQQVTPKLKLLGTLTYQDARADDGGYTYYYPPAGRTIEQWKTVYPYSQSTSKLAIGSINADYDLDWATLTMYALHGRDDSTVWSDISYFTTLFSKLNVPTFGQSSLTHSDSSAFEARLASKGEGPLRYTVGAYYSTRERSLNQYYLQPAMIPVIGTDNLYTTRVDTETNETALFGEATYRFAELWSATAGLRASKNDFHLTSSLTGLISGGPTPLLPANSDVVNNGSAITPKLAISYQPDSATNVYATAAKGYRYGLTNYFNGATLGKIPLPYDPDSLWNYELGLKKSMLGGKLVSNTALYYIDWKDIQFGFRNAQNTLYTANAGNARAYGIEEEFSFRPNSAWELNMALALSRAEMAADSPRVGRRGASARGPAVLGILKGDRLPGAPEVTFSGGVQYNIGELMGGRAHVRLDTAYIGSSYVDFMSEGSLKIGGYNTTNLRLGYTTGRYDWVVYANNLFNKRGIANAIPNYDVIGLTDAAMRVKPLTMGLTLRMQY